MSEDMILLLTGAGIALVSTLLTSVVTAIINYLIDRRAKDREKYEAALRQIGHLTALAWNPDDLRELSHQIINMQQGGLEGDETINIQADLMVGFLDGFIERYKAEAQPPVDPQS